MERRGASIVVLLALWIGVAPCHGDDPAPAPVFTPLVPPGTTPAHEVVKLQAPPLEAGDVPLPINLASALRLADGRPLVVAAAQASAWVAEAQLQRAKVLWVPELDIGAVYLRHDGVGPDFNRGNNPNFSPTSQMIPINQNINYFYGGGGLYAVWATTDAIFTPLAARQVLDSRRADIQRAKNDALLQAATAYFNVHRQRGTYAGMLDTVARGEKLVERVRFLSKDLVPKVEVDRARRLLADLEQQATSAREEWRIASADLTQILRLDPRAVIVPTEHDHLQITLIDPSWPLDDLVPIALTNRPELASQRATIQAALVRIRMEKMRPFLPLVLLTGFQTPNGMRMQFGAFGTGEGAAMNNWSIREDVSAQMVWQLDGLGLGNLARIKRERAEQSRATVMLYRLQDAVAADVTRSQAAVQSASARVLQAERSLRQAIITFDGTYEGLRQTRRFGDVLEEVFRPQEAVVALDNLRSAYVEYFGTVAEYNRAQFQMFHALGYPARDIAYLRPPGEAMPVETSRPEYMPAVGEGPPPATR
jgi:hypothetical protein